MSKNTASWVDEHYAKRLGKQLFDHVKGADNSQVNTLKGMRKSELYIYEETARIGFGVGKPATRVYYIDNSIYNDLLYIATFYYDQKGRLVTKPRYIESELFKITRHAYERMFERLRTNARDDVIALLKTLLTVPMPIGLDEKVEIVVPGVGKFHAVSDRPSMVSIGHAVWVLKTFVREKK